MPCPIDFTSGLSQAYCIARLLDYGATRGTYDMNRRYSTWVFEGHECIPFQNETELDYHRRVFRWVYFKTETDRFERGRRRDAMLRRYEEMSIEPLREWDE